MSNFFLKAMAIVIFFGEKKTIEKGVEFANPEHLKTVDNFPLRYQTWENIAENIFCSNHKLESREFPDALLNHAYVLTITNKTI